MFDRRICERPLNGVDILERTGETMKPNTVAILAAGCLGLVALPAEQSLTSTDIEHARVYLRQTQDLIVGATKGLSSAQWNFKPAADRWSIAEIVEHVVLVQEFMLGPVRQQLAAAPAPVERDTEKVDAMVINQLPDRTTRFKAPEFVQPAGRWTPSAAMDRLRRHYAELIEYLENTPDLRRHAVDAPPIKAISKGTYETMDGYQWILAAGAHVERHTKQILEVKADSSFPAK
jgi:hypothetical protein